MLFNILLVISICLNVYLILDLIDTKNSRMVWLYKADKYSREKDSLKDELKAMKIKNLVMRDSIKGLSMFNHNN